MGGQKGGWVVFLAAHGTFLVTGLLYVIGQQQLDYWGGNSPWSLFSGVSQYAGMSVFLLAGVCSTRRSRVQPADGPEGPGMYIAMPGEGASSPPPRRLPKFVLVLMVAIPDLLDTWFSVYGIVNAGSSVFIVVFSFVTVAAALLRRVAMGRRLHWLQWVAIVLITGGLSLTGIDAFTRPGGHSLTYVFGLVASLVASICDAFMYVNAEFVLSRPGGPTENEITGWVGAINLCFCVLWVAGIYLTGNWNGVVADPISAAGGHTLEVVLVWTAQAAILGLHYQSFYYCVSSTNSVAAGVNKALQSALVFFISAAVYCGKDGNQCLSTMKVASCCIVALGTILYSLRKAPASTPLSEATLGDFKAVDPRADDGIEAGT